MDRTWTGRVRPGAEVEHERFVAWLGSTEGQALLARSLLTAYRLDEQDRRLTVRMWADAPPPIIRFLRNRRFWPDFWEFESAEAARAVGSTALQRVTWQKSNEVSSAWT